MFYIDCFRLYLLTSATQSTITCTIIQKTKGLFKSSKYIQLYSFIINIIFSIIFCISFTTIKFPNSLWVGLFSYVGSDSIYKSLEGKIDSHTTIRTKKELRNQNKKSTKIVDKN